ncbi:MAG TPA: bifunctional adenosylcobinamide kinase/adenosylcobinamide-phosphate guanylyltransferase [Anaeromyxobacter sp.]|nr:bifunctional adenosylcobinamide kinase/adenosylcobinamide-phosphate guanylyltransferase [Anaeromyxobacter sp.]
MTERRFVLVGGGVRSGKSAYAVARARSLGVRRAFLATARAYDAEMAERIRRHQIERVNDFTTIEEPVALTEALLRLDGFDVAVIDCITLWLSNLLLDGIAADEIERRVAELTSALGRAPCHVVVVTNEVGMGVHPETPLGRLFRDLAGRAHQALSRAADEVHLAILGTLLRLKPGPVEAHFPGDAR